MKAHVKTYMNYFNYGIDDVIICECCQSARANDCHHIIYRSQGGGDNIENVIAVCRKCHILAHAEKISKSELQSIHNKFIENHETS